MNRGSHGRLPSARTEGLLLEDLGDEIVVFDAESKEAHCLAPVAAAVYAHCDGSNSVDELAALAGSRLGEPVAVDQVEAALAQLGERDLLASAPPTTRRAFSRRSFVRKTAVATAAAAAAPMVTSMVTTARAQGTASCPNSACSSDGDGDLWCNVIGVPQEDSCECLNASESAAVGGPAPPENRPCTEAEADAGTFGCSDTGNDVDGVCFLVPGDT
jgi:hypothetical protein